MRLRMFFLLLGVPTVLLVALVLVIRVGTQPSRTTWPRTRRPSPASAAPGSGLARSAGSELARVGTFDTPVYVTAPPGDPRRLFVVEQPGRIR